MMHQTYAATQITSRSLTLEDGATDGGSLAGGTVKHFFSFSLHDTTDSLGSITLQYCTTAAAVVSGIGCNAPTGVDVSGAALDNQTGATGFTTVTTTNQDDASDGIINTITLGRGAAANLVSDPTATTYEISGVVNPSTANQTFFVRISTYSSLDGSGAALESGTVAASTASAINLQGTMPESLVFCTGETISKTGGVPDCTTATSGDISFNQLFDPTSTAHATSQMAASTNAGSGYAITVGGPTLTSGSNTINAIGGTAETSTLGTSQFGMNLAVNTTPAVGSAVDPASNSTNYLANAQSGFDTADNFAFDDAALNTVAASDDGGSAGPSDSQIYTASYIVNVPGSQPAGTYTTTLTYICTPTF